MNVCVCVCLSVCVCLCVFFLCVRSGLFVPFSNDEDVISCAADGLVSVCVCVCVYSVYVCLSLLTNT